MLEAILGPRKTSDGSTDEKPEVHKPWVHTLANNKKKWKEQAAKGKG